MAARLLVGTSGYVYGHWRHIFYPRDVPSTQWLAFYARHFATVELNNPFYRLPEARTFRHWAGQVPPGFVFAVKASRYLTHLKRLREPGPPLSRLLRRAAALGPRLGPVLFQLPPFLKKDLARLQEFLKVLPQGHAAAFEFRNASWFDDAVYAVLEDAGAALCLSEREDDAPPPLVETAGWGYLRLRLEEYGAADFAQWAEKIAATRWSDAYAYFMHEPTAPGYAQALLRATGAVADFSRIAG